MKCDVWIKYFDSDVYKVHVRLGSFIKAQGSSKQDFCVENCPLHTMVRSQVHAEVKCLQNIFNNVTAEKSHDLVTHTH